MLGPLRPGPRPGSTFASGDQPFAQEPVGHLSVVLRADAAQATLADGVRAALRAIDPAQSASELRPVSDTIIQTVAPR